MTQHRDEAVDRTVDEAADENRDDDRVRTRSELLPEEQAAGSDIRREQAEAILAESDERTAHPEETREESTQTPDQQNPNEPA